MCLDTQVFTGPKFNRGYEVRKLLTKSFSKWLLLFFLADPVIIIICDLGTAASAQEIFEISGIPRVSKGLIKLALSNKKE